MKNQQSQFEFTAAIFKEGKQFVSLCLDVDVASTGRTPREARKMLAEAVSLYLEACIDNNLPYLRPIPRDEDPRLNPPPNLVEIVPLKVTFTVNAVA